MKTVLMTTASTDSASNTGADMLDITTSRLLCVAHTLLLAMKDGLKSVPASAVVEFFRRSVLFSSLQTLC